MFYYLGATVVVAGWGRKYFNGPRSKTLLKVNLEMSTQETCTSAYGYGLILDGMMCAYSEGKDTCQVAN